MKIHSRFEKFLTRNFFSEKSGTFLRIDSKQKNSGEQQRAVLGKLDKKLIKQPQLKLMGFNPHDKTQTTADPNSKKSPKSTVSKMKSLFARYCLNQDLWRKLEIVLETATKKIFGPSQLFFLAKIPPSFFTFITNKLKEETKEVVWTTFTGFFINGAGKHLLSAWNDKKPFELKEAWTKMVCFKCVGNELKLISTQETLNVGLKFEWTSQKKTKGKMTFEGACAAFKSTLEWQNFLNGNGAVRNYFETFYTYSKFIYRLFEMRVKKKKPIPMMLKVQTKKVRLDLG